MEKIYAVLNKYINTDGDIYFEIVKAFKTREKAEKCLKEEERYSIKYWEGEDREYRELTREETQDKFGIDGIAFQISPEISETYDIYYICEVGLC